MKSRTSKPLLQMIAVLAVAAGCSSSTSPIMDAVVFQGEIAHEGRVIHPLTLTDSGTLHIEFTSIVQKPMEGVEPSNLDWPLGIGVGRPVEAECNTTYSAVARMGQLQVIGLNEADYCFVVFDTGFPSDEIVLEYSLMVSPANR